MAQQLQAVRRPAQTQPVAGRILQRVCACGQHVEGGECEACQEKGTGTLQRAAVRIDAGGADAPPIVHDVLRSSGQPLDDATRAYMEPRFGHDFSAVRVHTDDKAAASARAVNALAYTVGNHVAFNTGQHRPDTASGRRLFAHELTHVIQQTSYDVTSPGLLRSGSTYALGERDAETAARAVSNGSQAHPNQRVTPGTLARQPEAEDEGPGVLGTLAGGLIGEFNEDPNFAMIGVDTVVSLVPILDQVSDARDVVAHVYYLSVHRQYDRVLRWVGLVLTLIGLFPELGSAIKSASKFIIKGVREVLGHLDDILKLFRRILPEIGEIGRLHRYMARHWKTWVDSGTQVFMRILDRISAAGTSGSLAVRTLLRRLLGSLAHIRDIAPARLRAASDWVWGQIDNVLNQVRERLGRGTGEVPKGSSRPAIEGAEDVNLSQAEYESALGRAFPSHFFNQITRTVDDIGERAAQRASADPRFVQAVQNRNWTLAGTLFHSAAAREARALPPSALPTGWTIRAEEVIQSGSGGSRADILLRGPGGELVEFDWKTTGKSALSSGSRSEMTRHAGQIATNIGGTLTTQQSRSWVDFVRPLLPGLPWPGS